MTLREWLAQGQPGAPQRLVDRILDLLGTDAEAPVERAPAACLDAAARLLRRLQAEARFGRDDAMELLAVDALVTMAFELASRGNATPDEIAALAHHGASRLSELSLARV